MDEMKQIIIFFLIIQGRKVICLRTINTCLGGGSQIDEMKQIIMFFLIIQGRKVICLRTMLKVNH